MRTLYADASVPIRPDLAAAHLATVEGYAQAGNHWTGAERLAMVAEVRRARAADELLPWVRPTTVDGLIAEDHPLPAAAVDAIWRLTNHPGTLTRDWYEETVAGELDPGRYVELVGVVATANCLEVFAQAVGVDPVPLPAPTEDEPLGPAAVETAVSSHWVPTEVGTRGPNVGKALTAVPASVAAWRHLSDAQYVPGDALLGDLHWSRGAIDRAQVELLAARTSLLNECFY
ncbi:MAG: alkylhydroperoxidase-related (seleno)protein [Actinomycetota bacterium]